MQARQGIARYPASQREHAISILHDRHYCPLKSTRKPGAARGPDDYNGHRPGPRNANRSSPQSMFRIINDPDYLNVATALDGIGPALRHATPGRYAVEEVSPAGQLLPSTRASTGRWRRSA